MNRRTLSAAGAAWLIAALVGLASWEIGPLHADEPVAVVSLVIDFSDGVEKRFAALPWKSNMTVLDALELAQRHPRGIRFKFRGKGATAFLTEIDDLKNEGGNRNWIYKVNGELGDRSFAVYPLDKGDAVLWKFGKYE